MTDAVIVSIARTPLAKSWRGAFNITHGATLAGHVVQQAIARAGVDPVEVEDVLLGCAYPEGADGLNIARQALRAGCPVTTGGATVNRFCSSGLQTIAMAAGRVILKKRRWSSRAVSSRSPACRTSSTGTCCTSPGSWRANPTSTCRCCRPRKTSRSATAFRASARTNTARGVSSVPRPRRRPGVSTPRSRPSP